MNKNIIKRYIAVAFFTLGGIFIFYRHISELQQFPHCNKIYLAVFSIFAGCLGIYFEIKSHRKHSKIKSLAKSSTVSALNSPKIIKITDMTRTELDAAISDFSRLYADAGPVEIPIIKEDGTDFLLTLHSTDFNRFCNFLNYLVYSNRNKRFDVTGWCEVSPLEIDMGYNDKRMLFNGMDRAQLMLFIPEDDKDYDLVYFVTPNNACYVNPLGRPLMRAVYDVLKTYQPAPQITEE